MDYGDIFKRGFLHTWNNKFLYILGFLAALGGSAGGSNFNFQSTGNINPGTFGGGGFSGSGDIEDALAEMGREFGFDPSNLESIIPGIIGAVIAVTCVLLIVRLVLWFIRLIAEAGMIQAVSDLETGVKTNFRKAFADGRSFMMKFFLTQLILFIIPFIVIILALVAGALTIIPIMRSGGGNADEVFAAIGFIAIPFICLICLLVPYNVITSLIYPIGQRGIVFKGMEPMESLKYGWEILKRQPAEILLLAVMYVVIGFIIGIVSTVVFVPILFASGWPVISALINGNTPGVGAFSLLGVGVLAAIVVAAVINAIYVSFRSASFTLAYLQLEGKQVEQF
ncbi:MAG: hypothetical protein AB8G95_30160 [Anaerolineae bacterium]